MDNDLSKAEAPDRWITRDLARYATQIRFEDYPADVVALAKTYILDSAGCMIGGVRAPIGAAMARTIGAMGGAPQSSVLGTATQTSMINAALVNGTTCNALDFDETLTGIGHPGSSLIPAALAVGEHHGVSGKTLINAVLVGYEVGNRIGLAIQPTRARAQEVWCVGTWQAMSAAAAAAKILGLELEQTLNAYGVAGATAPLPNTQKWGWPMYERPIHWVKEPTGWPAWTGTLAALLAAEGFLGNRWILDGDTGFWRMAGSDRCDFDRMTRGLGSDFEIKKVGLKPFPCCRWHHSPLECVRKLKAEHDLAPSDVAGVAIHTFDWLKAQELYGPRSVVDSQFSLPHTVTMIVHAIKPGGAWVTNEMLQDEALIEWSRRVTITVDPDLTRRFHEEGKIGARVVIRTTGGRTLTSFTEVPPGDLDNPMSQDEVHGKFLGLAEEVIGRSRAEQVIDGFGDLEKADNIGDLLTLCCSAPASRM